MSEDQPPPRIKICLPLMENTRLPLVFSSEVISRMPKLVSALSEVLPSASNVMFSLYSSGFPICAGHHRRGLSAFSCETCDGSNVTSFCSLGPSSTSCENSVFSICPFSTPFTGCLLPFFSNALTVRWALPSASTFDTTVGYRSATGPLVRTSTPRQRPIFLSGGEGFQSTNVIAKSRSVGENTSTARTLDCPGRAASNVEFVGAPGAGDVVVVADLLAVQKNVGAVIDATKIHPNGFAFVALWQGERLPVPPGNQKRAVLPHRDIGKIRANGIVHARKVAQIHSVIRVRVNLVLDKCRDHRRGHADRVPARRSKFRSRNYFATLLHLARRLQRPAIAQLKRVR